MKHLGENSISKNIIELATKLEMTGNRHLFEKFGLTSSTVRILYLLMQEEVLTLSEILSRVGSSKSNISQRLSFLEKKGYIERGATNVIDRRKVGVTLTDKGRQVFLDVMSTLQSEQYDLSRLFKKEEVECFLSFCRKLNIIIDKFNNENSKCKKFYGKK